MDSWANLTNEECEAIADTLPGGVRGYLTEWGWLTFARAVEERLRLKNAPEAPLRPDMRAVLERVRTNLHDHASHADAFADHITRLLSQPHAEGGES
jgi:hypothetical protein